jgi:uncharacterized BrkB/YihY/UPF0761 family membrane protein
MARAASSRARARSRSTGGWTGRLEDIVRRLAADSAEHHLWTYASAISFRALVALVPLLLLGLALLSALGLEGVWSSSVAPAVQAHVTPPVYAAINFSVEKIFSSSAAGLIAFAAALLVWDMTWAVSTVMEALNEIHGVEEGRSWPRRVLVALPWRSSSSSARSDLSWRSFSGQGRAARSTLPSALAAGPSPSCS